MKKLLSFLIVVLIFCSASSYSQKKGAPPLKQTEISLLGGYLFTGSYDGIEGKVDALDRGCFGVTIGYRPQKLSTLTIELEYLGSPGKVVLTPFSIDSAHQIEEADVSINYFLLGVGYGTMVSRTAQLFSMFKLGMVYSAPSGNRYESTTNFAGSFSVGAKFYVSKSVGIRLQGGLYAPIRFSGGGFFVGTGGVDYGVSSTGTITQFSLEGGIIFML
jgi:hypothetical protein